jgi:hypothetical protein
VEWREAAGYIGMNNTGHENNSVYGHEVKIRGGGKTVHFVFKYLS